jgi:hypothetical protein
MDITLKGVGAITIRQFCFHRLSSISCEGPAGKNFHTNLMQEKEHLLQLFHYSMKYLPSNTQVRFGPIPYFAHSPLLVGLHSARKTAH